MAIHPFRIAGLLLILIITAASYGCKHKPPTEPPAGSFLEDIFTTVNTNPDLAMFCRSMPGYLDEMEGLMKKNKYDLQAIFRSSGTYFGYAFCCMEDTDKKEAGQLYLKGRDLALSELRRYSFFDQAVDESITKFRQALPYNFDKRNIQPLFWAAMNWFGWVRLNLDMPEARADIPKVEAMLEYVNSLDRAYENGIVHAVLGAVYALQPENDGGDPDKARQEFENAFLYTGNSILVVHVLYAEFYATRIKDRELFQKTLQKVLNTPPDKYPDKTFVNEVARRKAKLLLDNMDAYFSQAQEMKIEEETPAP
ncbi:MAG TPA: TRAP transporter TatT component family protein [Deltaproteobacteria bacterium]|nr:TRAP transporter TatT component family protein [Deltaproteobacteria bacterium]HPR53939.1 TRAP transporter TatT component family protein [Deltaproteobacteria bacterium]HXK46739.1 TRAP transporter TatT component family protein [Deltaproteobacteria bacterium]